MLKRLYVDNVRCFTNFELVPEATVGLVGPNGGGKSTVLQVLSSLRTLLVSGSEIGEQFPAWSRTRRDQRLIQQIELEAEITGSTFTYSLAVLQDPERGQCRIQEERLTSDGDLLYEFVDGHVRLFGDDPLPDPRTHFPFVATRSFLPMLEPRPDNARITAFKLWLSGIWLFQLRPFDIRLFSEQESPSLSITGENYVSFFRVFVQEHPELIAKIVEDVRPAIPGLTNSIGKPPPLAVRLEKAPPSRSAGAVVERSPFFEPPRSSERRPRCENGRASPT